MARRRGKPAVKRRLSRSGVTQSRNEWDIVVLFADVVGCSEVSNQLSLEDYNTFITGFQDCFKKVCKYYKTKIYERHEYSCFDYEVRGDEGCLKIFVSREAEKIARDVDAAISIALDMKRKWLFTEYNAKRIQKYKLPPVDIAMGIHLGKAFVNESSGGAGGGRPEGYAINLAKRIENASRDGKFSHILVSESAHGQLYYLADERVYKFDRSFCIDAKGLSPAMKAFEIKHHFLPTDWTDVVIDEPSELSMVYESPDEKSLKLVEEAYEINPTNLWLAEEYLTLTMVNAYCKLSKENKTDDLKALEKAYEPALKIAQRITNSDLRDAGLLCTWGLILGELERYSEEQEKYREAKRFEEADGEIHWYLAYSMSAELDSDFRRKKIELRDFYDEEKQRINRTLQEYRRALDLSPRHPWIIYDYASELAWWSQIKVSYRQIAIETLIKALLLKPMIEEWAREEGYLKPIIADPEVKRYLR